MAFLWSPVLFFQQKAIIERYRYRSNSLSPGLRSRLAMLLKLDGEVGIYDRVFLHINNTIQVASIVIVESCER